MSSGVICPHCGADNLDEQTNCVSCNKLLPPQYSNYFTALGLPVQYNIESSVLDEAFYKLIARFHPDQYVHSTDLEKEIASQYSSYYNRAYNTLRDKLNRLEYMLLLYDPSLNLNNVYTPPDLLLQALEWHESLVEVGSAEEIQHHIYCIAQTQQSYYNSCMQHSFEHESDKMLDLYVRLKFISRYKLELLRKLEEYD